jgi:membrane AbrB-like protein
MKVEDRRTCAVCGSEFSGGLKFCPVCMLRKGFAGEVESGESSSEDILKPATEQATQRFEHYELVKDEDGKPVELGRGAMGVTLSHRPALLPITAVLFAFGLQAAHMPAAWLFGPLVASALFAVRDWQAFELPRSTYIAAQAVVGTALGAGFSPATLMTLPKHFSIFAFAVVFILLTSLFNGWLLTRHTRLDVATALLGTMPGGAGEMAAMSESLRADSRLVVIMQYRRLLLILASLGLVTPFLS